MLICLEYSIGCFWFSSTGIYALKAIFKGATEIAENLGNKASKKFTKVGNQKTALRDFYATNPEDVQNYYFPFGV